MALATVAYRAKVHHDGREYEVRIPALEVPKCTNCHAISLDEVANTAIDRAFRRQAGLLTPEQIREGREKLGLNQQQFADWVGINVSTLSRWENGAQIQQRIMDDVLRAFFEVPQFKEFLRVRHGISGDLLPAHAGAT
jgi:putative zinc finger/helix-turn-helix YgiT family protein